MGVKEILAVLFFVGCFINFILNIYQYKIYKKGMRDFGDSIVICYAHISWTKISGYIRFVTAVNIGTFLLGILAFWTHDMYAPLLVIFVIGFMYPYIKQYILYKKLYEECKNV